MAKNEAKIKFSADCQEFNSQIQKANSTMQQLRAEMKLNEAQMKANGTSVEGLEDKYQILANQFDASGAKIAALQGKLDAAIRNFGEGSTEVDKWRTQLLNAQTAQVKIEQAMNECNAEIKAQKSALDQAENAMDSAENAAKTLDDAIDEAGNSAKEASEGFTVMKGALADMVADGIQSAAEGLANIGAEAFTMANDIDSATNTFIAKTGESVGSAEQFEDVMTNIYRNNYGESFDDIAESMATVKTALGDIGDDELEKVTTDALVLRDTFDMDVNESIRAVNSMMDQFGITADEAYNLIAQGAQSGLNQNGDLLDTINEYSVQFENAGYSAEDMFNMLANGVDTGTWSVDKLGDAVKEFNIRMSDGSAKDAVEALGFSWEEVSADWSKGGDSAKEVFNMLFNELDGLENTTEGYGIGVGLLGTMYEDLGQDAVLALSNTNGAISTSKDALGQINAVKYDDLGSAIEGIKRNLQISVSEPIKNEVMPAVNEFVQDVDWEGVGQTIGEVMGVAIDAFFSFVEGVKEAVQWMKEHKTLCAVIATAIGVVAAAITAYNVVQGIKAAMDAAQVTTIWALVAAQAAQAAAAIAAVAPYVLIVAAITAVIAIIVLCIKHWDDIKAACSKAWESIKNATSKAWTSIKTAISNAWNSIKSSVSNAINNVKSKVQSVWNSVKSVTSSAWNAVKTTVSSVWNGIKSSVSNAIGNVKSTISSGLNAAKSTVSNVLNSIKSKFTSIWDNCKSIVSNAINKIKGFFNFSWSLPKIKLPHFSISGKFSLNPPSIPKFSVSWYKDGAIFTKPTLFNTPYGLKGVGEAGAEAVLPIEKLEDYISGAIERASNIANLNALATAIEDLASRPINLNVNGRTFAVATAGDSDSVNGFRSTLQGRGLAL